MIEVDIKWVNDIYFKNKIAGILTEAMTSVETGSVTDVIIGLGINSSKADFPEDLKEKSRAASLCHLRKWVVMSSSIVWNCFYNTDSDELLYIYKERSNRSWKVTFQLDEKLKKVLQRNLKSGQQVELKINKLSI